MKIGEERCGYLYDAIHAQVMVLRLHAERQASLGLELSPAEMDAELSRLTDRIFREALKALGVHAKTAARAAGRVRE